MLLSILLCCVSVCEGSHILVVVSVPEKSHNVLADSLVDTLLDAHYEVTYVTPYRKGTRPNLNYVDISSDLDQIQDDGETNEAGLPEDTSSARYPPLQGTRFARQLLKHPDIHELMMNTTLEFDAVLVEWFYTGLLAPLAAVFECPLIWYTPTDISWQSLSLVTDTPAHRLDLPPTSLVDRLHHMWFQMYLSVWNYLYVSRIEIPAYEKGYREAFKVRRRYLPNYELVVNDGSMLLLNSHPLLGPAVSLPGNVKYIGGHHIPDEVPPPLPKNLKKVMDSSAAGVIYVNMESNLINSNIHDEITRELSEVFSDLEQTVVLKHEDILVNLPHNVYTLKNPLQHSILSNKMINPLTPKRKPLVRSFDHTNTVAFINLGDMTSILDATQHGVPVVALPLLEHQAANVNMMRKRGCGVSVDTNNLAREVKKSLKEILNNSSYVINAQNVRTSFRHHLVPPRQEFIHWIETVIGTRGAPHLRSPALHTAALERYNADIILLVLMICWFLTKVAKVVRAHLDVIEDHEKED